MHTFDRNCFEVVQDPVDDYWYVELSATDNYEVPTTWLYPNAFATRERAEQAIDRWFANKPIDWEEWH